ncbi:hypothetical protein MLD38_012276 [Melastoma candidum]|uniref:Uncharacterized protein n=1 Tax=Melastoma candidum TaxID=119954 RepID=A0ACB9R5Y0_9MYRT|nr:hypothetical protein MLD38_012276 [Melastoma candidum]
MNRRAIEVPGIRQLEDWLAFHVTSSNAPASRVFPSVDSFPLRISSQDLVSGNDSADPSNLQAPLNQEDATFAS